MSLTNAQQSAVAARGNVLVIAGAGTGKTSTLVERCLALLLEEKPALALDEVLIVTFTEAAAAEIRQRIRRRLETELNARRGPGDSGKLRHLREQLALFETAHIGTLHSFCLQLVRQHFYELELDPQLSVLPNEEAHLLAAETLDGILQRHYAGRTPSAARVQELIEAQSRGADKSIRALILRLHHYMQTRPDSRGWLAAQEQAFARTDAAQWQAWLKEGIAGWALTAAGRLAQAAAANAVAATCAGLLSELQAAVAGPAPEWKTSAAATLARIAAAKNDCPRGKKGLWIKPLESFFADVDFLAALLVDDNGGDPVTQDWLWVREQMRTLLELVREFTQNYTDAKRELGAVDFHDLEQYALQLLWNRETGEISDIGREWRRRLRFVFVDEYQDINAAQDKIIEGLSRDAASGNRFLVGDVKQSIYRFRLAEPRIFQNYAELWRGNARVIALRDNFRSNPGILSFVNSLFSLVMRRPTGGVEYDAEAALVFGHANHATAPSPPAPEPAVELHLLLKPSRSAPEPEGGGAGGDDDLEDAAKEARLVGLRLAELRRAGRPVWDRATESRRPMEWRDVAVLLRSPANKAESYAKEFSRLGIPLEVARGGFYENLEICDLLNLLRLLDNPLQDLPLVAVLRSPLVALDLNDLARIRLTGPGPFWTALVRFDETADPAINQTSRAPAEDLATWTKARAFLERFARWRPLARQGSLSQCLESVLAETHYADWILTQDRGRQRHGNIRRLLALARQFDEFQQQGLFRFLRFIDAQMEADTEPEVASVAEENAVRLLSIHQSKGLEFPVVVVADLAKTFNDMDLRSDLILDEEYGLCPQIKPPQSNTRYPSLPYWLARQRQRRELLGEELRLLYVATTRARDLLLLTGAITEPRFERDWVSAPESAAPEIDSGRSYADWVAEWFRRHVPLDAGATAGQNDLLKWQLYRDADLALPEVPVSAGGETRDDGIAASPDWEQVRQKAAWQYAFAAPTRQPAKTSVTALRQQVAEQRDDAALPLFDAPEPLVAPSPNAAAGPVAEKSAAPHGADAGRANHRFLELLSLDRAGTPAELRAEAARLVAEKLLSAEESAALDIEGIAAFWQSDLGRTLRAHKEDLRREIAFTARFPAADIATLLGKAPDAALAEEFVVVQGVADLAVFRENEIWIVDFKTDALTHSSLAEKVEVYAPQLKLYARALSRIYRKPVTNCWLYFLAARTAVPVNPA
jgi:ATP-dependent helicase/nuclease subunit A